MNNTAAAVASLKENMECVNEALEKAQKCLLGRVQNLEGKTDEQQELSKLFMNETAKVAGNRSNMAAAVDCLAENLTSVNEGLEGISISDNKRNMAAALASLIENFQTVNEALEGPSIPDLKRNMAAPEVSSTENLLRLKEALEKAKKLWLQRVQNLDRKIDEQLEGTQRNTASAVGSLTENLQCVNEALEGLSVSDYKRKMVAELASLTERLHSINETVEKSKKHLLQRIQIFAEKKDELLEYEMSGFDKEQVEVLSIENVENVVESLEKADEHWSLRLQNLKEKMDELEKNQEYMALVAASLTVTH